VRAMISNGLLRGARHKVWCVGPMFRHERPQKGRYRQFHQLDVEVIGLPGPDVDAELIALTARLWRRLGIERMQLQINSLGTAESRRAYRELLSDYFRAHAEQLDADSQRRLEGNPLRILDSKNPAMQALVAAAPVLTDHLDPESRAHFEQLQQLLTTLGIPFRVNPRLVRGLDYYSRTVFEWTTDALGAQDAVCSGGRYDGLIAQLGGEATPAIGFAMGIERAVALIEQGAAAAATPVADLFVVAQGDQPLAVAFDLSERLRELLPQARIELNLGGGNFKAQFRRADKSGASWALVLGEDELQRGVVQLKPLRGPSGASQPEVREFPLATASQDIAAALANGSRVPA